MLLRYMVLWLMFAGVCLAVTPVSAAEPMPGAPQVDWSAGPPEPADRNAWIKLRTGDWLHVELSGLNSDDRLATLNDVMGDRVYRWGDVVALYVYRPLMWIKRDRSTLTGTAILKDGLLQVRTVDGVVELPRRQIAGFVPGKGREIDLWDFEAKAGVDFRVGNSEQFTFTAGATVMRTGAVVVWGAGYDGSVGRANRVQNVNWHRAATDLDIFITSVFFLIPITGDAYYDEFQNIAIRLRPSAGVGFRWEPSDPVTIKGRTAGVFQYTRYTQQLADGTNTFSGGGLLLRLNFTWRPSTRFDLVFDWATNIIFNDLGQTGHDGRFGVAYQLIGSFSVYSDLIFSRIEKPPQAEDGTTPQPNDLQWVAGIQVSI